MQGGRRAEIENPAKRHHQFLGSPVELDGHQGFGNSDSRVPPRAFSFSVTPTRPASPVEQGSARGFGVKQEHRALRQKELCRVGREVA